MMVDDGFFEELQWSSRQLFYLYLMSYSCLSTAAKIPSFYYTQDFNILIKNRGTS